jgi:hypothetical protein
MTGAKPAAQENCWQQALRAWPSLQQSSASNMEAAFRNAPQCCTHHPSTEHCCRPPAQPTPARPTSASIAAALLKEAGSEVGSRAVGCCWLPSGTVSPRSACAGTLVVIGTAFVQAPCVTEAQTSAAVGAAAAEVAAGAVHDGVDAA